MSKDVYLEDAIEWVKRRAIDEPLANFEGYEQPKSYTNKSTQEEICPDFSFKNNSGTKNYTDIAIKQDDVTSLVTRWKLLSTMISMKRGKLYLLAPRGHKMFVSKLIDTYNIKAVIQSI